MLQQEEVFCQSPVERRFWWHLCRVLQKWESHHPVGLYWLDFVLLTHKLAIELDGYDIHKTKEQGTYDALKGRS
jgi:very-short-patch-repair endonuclease